jgi:hypothetical protein
MRKRIINHDPGKSSAVDDTWLNLESLARVEVSSEDPQNPIEAAFELNPSSGWRAATLGQQIVRLLFDEPQNVRLIHLVFDEHEQERLQEYALSWCPGGGQPYREIVRQQYTFSPPTTSREVEDHRVNLDGCTGLELSIIPDVRGSAVRASIAQFRMA